MLTTISKGDFSVSIDSLGTQLMSLNFEGREYLWQGIEKYWGGRAPILFPMVGMLRNDMATSSVGPIHMKRHGIARNYEHKISRRGSDFVTYELVSSPKTLSAFPFPFQLNMTFRIIGASKLEQRYEVTNIGEVTLPFVVGGHPAFNVPVGEAPDERFEDYSVFFTKKMTYSSPTIDVPTGIIDFAARRAVMDDTDELRLTHPLFEQDAVVFEDVPGNTVTLAGGTGGHSVRVDFEGFRYLGIWSAAHDAPFVAIEPWTGVATAADESDVFEEKRGMELLEPGATSIKSFEVTLG